MKQETQEFFTLKEEILDMKLLLLPLSGLDGQINDDNPVSKNVQGGPTVFRASCAKLAV